MLKEEGDGEGFAFLLESEVDILVVLKGCLVARGLWVCIRIEREKGNGEVIGGEKGFGGDRRDV